MKARSKIKSIDRSHYGLSCPKAAKRIYSDGLLHDGLLAAAVEDSQRGTLHVVLTHGNDAALQISTDARQHLQVSSAAVSKFAGRYEESTGLKADICTSTDPRAVAASAHAQIQSLSSQLNSGGKHASILMLQHF